MTDWVLLSMPITRDEADLTFVRLTSDFATVAEEGIVRVEEVVAMSIFGSTGGFFAATSPPAALASSIMFSRRRRWQPCLALPKENAR